MVKEAMKSGRTVKEMIMEKHLLSPEELEEILDPYQMTSPGIAGARFLEEQG
ncbi:aspartate ammonia-lyase [compost metagenome]